MKKFLSLIRFPNLLIMLLTQMLVRKCLVFPERSFAEAFTWPFGVLLLATLCIAAAGYIINDYYDLKIDRINKPERIILGNGLTRRRAIIIHLYLTGAGVLLGGLLGWKIGSVCLGSALLLWGYSAQFKKRPLVGNITIGLLAAAMVLIVSLQAGKPSLATWAYGIFAFIISLIREIIKDMEDVRGDASFRCRTLPIILGLPRTKWVLYFLILGFLGFTFFVMLYKMEEPFFIEYLTVLVLLPTLFMTWKLIHADRKRDYARLSWFCKGIMLTGICSMLILH